MRQLTAVIIPARGDGERIRALRADGNKLLLPWGKGYVVDALLDTFSATPDEIVIVTLPQHLDELAKVVGDRASIVSHPREERDSPVLSLAVGLERLSALPGNASVAVLFSDTILARAVPLTSQQPEADVAFVKDGFRYQVWRGMDYLAGAQRWSYPLGEHKPALAAIGIYRAPLTHWSKIVLPDKCTGLGDMDWWAFYPREVPVDSWHDAGTVESYSESCRRSGHVEWETGRQMQRRFRRWAADRYLPWATTLREVASYDAVRATKIGGVELFPLGGSGMMEAMEGNKRTWTPIRSARLRFSEIGMENEDSLDVSIRSVMLDPGGKRIGEVSDVRFVPVRRGETLYRARSGEKVYAVQRKEAE